MPKRNIIHHMLVAVALLAVVAGCGDDSATGPGTPRALFGSGFDSFQKAAVIIGQTDGTSKGSNAGNLTPVSFGISGPFGNAADAGNGSIYIPDQGNFRLLGFNTIPAVDGAPADFVVGQADFTSRDNAVSASRFSATDCWVGDGKLFVTNVAQNRVLIWNSLPRGDVAADVVVGQPNFTSTTAQTSQSGLDEPVRAVAAGGKLFVIEYNNNRCLIWNAIPTVNNAPADVVVGQSNFTSGAAPTATDQASFGRPRALWTDGTRLIIGDTAGRRVLIWNSVPTSNGQPADVVVAAPDFNTAGDLGAAWGVGSDGRNLFIADGAYNRVLIYSPIPRKNGEGPETVLGQVDLTGVARNDDDQNGTEDTTCSRRTMAAPTAVTMIGGRLYVSDQLNHRYLVFKTN